MRGKERTSYGIDACRLVESWHNGDVVIQETEAPPGAGTPGSARPAAELAKPATAILLVLAGISFVVHMLVAGNYGYYRDELYYLADGRHLQAGYVDQPLMMGWVAALLRVIAGDGLVAIHVVPALACALIIVITGLMARELGGGRVGQLIAGTTVLFAVILYGFGSMFTMDVLDQLWVAAASLVLLRILRLNSPRLWPLIGVIVAVALLTKLTVLFFCLALALALLLTPQRRHLLTPWPWLAAGIAVTGLLPYLIWNALNGWPTWEFWHHYGRFSTSPDVFFAGQIVQMNPIGFLLAVAGLVFYFRTSGSRYRLLGWTFVFLYLILTYLRVKAYFIAPAYPILFAPGAVLLERWRLPSLLTLIRPAYLVALALVGALIAPDVLPILPPATLARSYPTYSESLADRFGWNTLTTDVERVYASLPPVQRAQSCVLTSNYGEAAALQQLAGPNRLPPVISAQNDYYIWGPGRCTGRVLIVVDSRPSEVPKLRPHYTHVALAAVHHCRYCVDYERSVRIYVLSGAEKRLFPQLWQRLKHFN